MGAGHRLALERSTSRPAKSQWPARRSLFGDRSHAQTMELARERFPIFVFAPNDAALSATLANLGGSAGPSFSRNYRTRGIPRSWYSVDGRGTALLYLG